MVVSDRRARWQFDMFACRQRQFHLVFNAMREGTSPGLQFHKRRGSCGAHTRERGCIEPAVTITMKLNDLTVLNNNVGNDAEGSSTTEDVSWAEGVSTTEVNANNDVSV